MEVMSGEKQKGGKAGPVTRKESQAKSGPAAELSDGLSDDEQMIAIMMQKHNFNRETAEKEARKLNTDNFELKLEKFCWTLENLWQ